MAPLQIWVRGRRWWYLFPPGSNPPALAPAMMIGYMANNVLPLRAGEFVRVYVVARRWGAAGHGAAARVHPFWTTLATLVIERVLDSLAVVLILAMLVLVITVPRFLEVAGLVVLAIDLVGIAILIALVVTPDGCARLIARLARRWPAMQRRALSVFETFVHGLDGIRTPSHALPLIAWTIAVWLTPALAAWTMLLALDLRLPFVAGCALLVQKFGGSSVADAEKITSVARRVAASASGNQLIVVVSAMGKTTDGLLALARQISTAPDLREVDMLLATGEQVTIALLTMALQSLDLQARSVTGPQGGIRTDHSHTQARITQIDADHVRRALDAGEIAVVAGFQGLSDEDEITTLGRGGSDLTAVALAFFNDTATTEIYTDVDGVYTADPNIV